VGRGGRHGTGGGHGRASLVAASGSGNVVLAHRPSRCQKGRRRSFLQGHLILRRRHLPRPIVSGFPLPPHTDPQHAPGFVDALTCCTRSRTRARLPQGRSAHTPAEMSVLSHQDSRRHPPNSRLSRRRRSLTNRRGSRHSQHEDQLRAWPRISGVHRPPPLIPPPQLGLRRVAPLPPDLWYGQQQRFITTLARKQSGKHTVKLTTDYSSGRLP
jgi:hypothetical protein